MQNNMLNQISWVMYENQQVINVLRENSHYGSLKYNIYANGNANGKVVTNMKEHLHI